MGHLFFLQFLNPLPSDFEFLPEEDDHFSGEFSVHFDRFLNVPCDTSQCWREIWLKPLSCLFGNLSGVSQSQIWAAALAFYGNKNVILNLSNRLMTRVFNILCLHQRFLELDVDWRVFRLSVPLSLFSVNLLWLRTNSILSAKSVQK